MLVEVEVVNIQLLEPVEQAAAAMLLRVMLRVIPVQLTLVVAVVL
jgi:hypothetical protein